MFVTDNRILNFSGRINILKHLTNLSQGVPKIENLQESIFLIKFWIKKLCFAQFLHSTTPYNTSREEEIFSGGVPLIVMMDSEISSSLCEN